MKNLIIPMAGKSSRFPNLRPKWMLTHPGTNNLMCVESILGLNLDFFDMVYFSFLKEHEEQYHISEGLKKCIEDNIPNLKFKIVILEHQTSSQSETVFKTIINESISGFIYVKDSDGFFDVNLKNTKNQICYHKLNNLDNVNANSKSYISLDSNNVITNIVEKNVISPNFCVGGYAFEFAEDFIFYYNKIKNFDGECYISNVIFEMMLDSKNFVGLECKNFLDWGTLECWQKFCLEFCTLFVDIDGTLITNCSEYVPPFIGNGKPITENILALQKKYQTKKVKIVLTTSRHPKNKSKTINELKYYGIPYDELIMGLPHSQRILINDFSNSNPYPTSISINIPRNSDNLKNYI